MNVWYVTTKVGFNNGIGPNDPDDEAIVLVFLTHDSATKYVEDNNLVGIATVCPVTVTEGHNLPPVQDQFPPYIWIAPPAVPALPYNPLAPYEITC